MQYILTLSGTGQDAETCFDHLRIYLKERYEPQFQNAIFDLLVSCQQWLSLNWEAMREIGLVTSEGVTNAILFALYDEIQAKDPMDWNTIPEVPLDPMIPKAQAHVDADKTD